MSSWGGATTAAVSTAVDLLHETLGSILSDHRDTNSQNQASYDHRNGIANGGHNGEAIVEKLRLVLQQAVQVKREVRECHRQLAQAKGDIQECHQRLRMQSVHQANEQVVPKTAAAAAGDVESKPKPISLEAATNANGTDATSVQGVSDVKVETLGQKEAAMAALASRIQAQNEEVRKLRKKCDEQAAALLWKQQEVDEAKDAMKNNEKQLAGSFWGWRWLA